jgi:hypothetical protein
VFSRLNTAPETRTRPTLAIAFWHAIHVCVSAHEMMHGPTIGYMGYLIYLFVKVKAMKLNLNFYAHQAQLILRVNLG